MLIDCDTCQVRGLHCGDCVVTVLLGPPAFAEQPGSSASSARTRFDAREHAALSALADGGLIPPLRLVSTDVDLVTVGDVVGEVSGEIDRNTVTCAAYDTRGARRIAQVKTVS